MEQRDWELLDKQVQGLRPPRNDGVMVLMVVAVFFAGMILGGLLIPHDPLTFNYVKEIATFAAEQRLPSMYGFREFCNAGGLLCYGTNLSRQISRYGYFIDKILKGTKPGDVPIEEPMTFELIVNARVAKSFDLTLPTSVLISADELIE